MKVMPHNAHRRSVLQEAAAEDASRSAVHVESSDTMRSRNAQCQAPPDNPETEDTYDYHSRERRSCAGQKIEHQNVHRRRSGSSASMYIRVYTSEADSTNPGCMEEACEYGLTRGTCFVARRLEVVPVAGLLWIYSVVCFFSVWWDFVFFLFVFFSSNAHGLLQV